MRTMQEHFAAIRAAEAAGDTEAAEYIRNVARQQQAEMDRSAYNPAAGQLTVENLRAGAGRGLVNIARNVGNIFGAVSDETINEANARDAALLDTTAGKVGNFIGETAAVTLPTMGVGGLVGRAGATGARLAANAIGRGAIEGAAQGAITAGPGERMGGAIMGAGVGTLIPGAGAAYRGLRSGVRPTAAAQRLMRDGIELTPGQMNPAGALNQIEEAAQALPYFGRVVTGARERGYQQFQAKVVQDVAPPGVTIAPKADVSAMVDDVAKAYDQAYDFAKGYPITPKIIRTQGGDVPLSKAFEDVVKHRGTIAKTDERVAISKFLRNELSALHGRSNQSDDLLRMRSNIRAAIRSEAPNSGTYRLLKNAEAKITDALDSQLPPDAMKALRATDAQYGKFKIMEDAVYRAKDQTGSFTPSQFSQAVRDAANKGEYARGGGRLRERAKAGVETFQARQPMTGRQALTVGPIVATALANPVTVGAPLAAGTAALYGTRVGNRFAAGQTGIQRGARQLERDIRRTVPKEGREAVARYSRNALVNYLDD